MSSAELFHLFLLFFSVDREESRWSQEAQKEPENDVALLLPQKKIPNMPMDIDSEGELCEKEGMRETVRAEQKREIWSGERNKRRVSETEAADR